MIPRVVHQLWIGPRPRPHTLLESWRAAHEQEGFEYRLWGDAEVAELTLSLPGLRAAIDAIPEINGKADVLRWQILFTFGGVFSDADSLCLRPVSPLLDAYPRSTALLVRENEAVRGPGCAPDMAEDIPPHVPVLATGFMAFPPGHAIPRRALEWIAAAPRALLASRAAWRTVGPGLLTRVHTALPPEERDRVTVLPSYTFLPVHSTGHAYEGHGAIYAHQVWDSTRRAERAGGLGREEEEASPAGEAGGAGEAAPDERPAASVSLLQLPPCLAPPAGDVSLLVCSHNTPMKHLRPCLDSILHQAGRFRIELVWVDDGSDALHAALLSRSLAELAAHRSRDIAVRPLVLPARSGVARALNAGFALCTAPWVARMDADDIMLLDRLATQLAFVSSCPGASVCGAQAAIFRDGEDTPHARTEFPAALRPAAARRYAPEDFPREIAVHPTLLFSRDALLALAGPAALGNGLAAGAERDPASAAAPYEPEFDGAEDFRLLLRLLALGHTLHTVPRVLLYYRLHPAQVTATTPKAHRAALQERAIRELGFG